MVSVNFFKFRVAISLKIIAAFVSKKCYYFHFTGTWIYSILSIFTALLIVGLEEFIFCKLKESGGFPDFEDYLAAIVPIPVFGGLLWAFIFQLFGCFSRQQFIWILYASLFQFCNNLLLKAHNIHLF